MLVKDAIKWLYPHGFNNDQEFLSSAIISATNRQVDQWNSIVQELNHFRAYGTQLKGYSL
jgi:SOS response regulatory protein OraA/RecX